ncbi:hypothetical protein N9N67_06405 [Bacteriovoracaceae bacterium]|nr:hypothetical protein [Bacteriovoracaceae bacterium]
MKKSLPFKVFRSKFFRKPWDSAESKFAQLIDEGRSEVYKSDFFLLRVGIKNWLSPNISYFPEGIVAIPPYWGMPWAYKIRKPITIIDKILKMIDFYKIKKMFIDLF